TAVIEALAHQDAVTDRVTRTIAERISVEERLRALGLEPAQSQANFCWFDLDVEDSEQAQAREEQVMRGLVERGVLVRGGGALGRPGALRVTYGTSAENAIFLDALAEAL
ncbi:MAG TPA: aminotransferase class I/II-fold pyridoxal phosphate-dependent enzyme, partial [Solirubrobacteraceae bacterium]